MNDHKPKEFLIVMLAANIACIGFIILTGWFAYLDNGYWGWPFVGSLLCVSQIKTRKQIIDDRKEEEFERQKYYKKFGDEFVNRVFKN